AYYNRGITYLKKGDYDKVIEDCNKAIELKSDNAAAYFMRGIAYGVKGDYDKAIEDYTKAIELKPDFAETYYRLIALCENENAKYIDTVIRILENNKKHFKINIVYAMSQYKNIDRIISKLLDIDYDDYFYQTLNKDKKTDKNSKEYNCYKEIYLFSIKIMQLLHVRNNEETGNGFVHYTRKDIAETLLIKKKDEGKVSPFRLNSILTSNDPTEGEIVFDYLGLENKGTDRDYQAFIACFTFDSECLNQFRLYGKEEGQEATGVSLVFNKNFFAENPAQIVSKGMIKGQDDKTVTQAEKTTIDKYPLYRCVYIDPKTKQIITLGHKDDYTFFRSYSEINEVKQNEIREKIDNYKKDINEKLQAVRDEFEALKKYIDNAKTEHNIKDQIVCDLLINLRYLIKHIAFKEEQECRIVKVETLANHDKVKLEGDKMFIETQAIGRFIDKIFFAPNAAGMELFQEKLIYYGSKHITCYQCEHPIRIARQ
ncbi:MAG: tetratricopeptide repeat protein, partial [Prevotellaceae bacterium]|nr:tetratricopeptide repeat protein [Prevotellaceae bacterium]